MLYHSPLRWRAFFLRDLSLVAHNPTQGCFRGASNAACIRPPRRTDNVKACGRWQRKPIGGMGYESASTQASFSCRPLPPKKKNEGIACRRASSHILRITKTYVHRTATNGTSLRTSYNTVVKHQGNSIVPTAVCNTS